MKPFLVSTRDPDEQRISLKEAILTSQPADGGLFTFPEFPQISTQEMKHLAPVDYQVLAMHILGKFDFGMTEDEMGSIIDTAYGSQWDHGEIVKLTQITDVGTKDDKGYLMELFHGPTQAFKDVALQFLPRVLSQYRTKGQVMRALGASSGDTISAAHFGVGNVEGLRSIFLLPAEGPSEIQRLQSTAHGFRNAITILIEGSFDDGQKVIKSILSDAKYADWKEEMNFISFNSINIARIMAQMVYYFSAYLQLVNKGVMNIGDEINFSVPSGNFGDALAGVYAKEMGLPIAKINVATNKNNILDNFLKTGVYRPGKKAVMTRAPSQDITKASNFERMIYLTVKDPRRVVELMNDLKEKGRFEVTTQELQDMRKILASSSTSDEEIDHTIVAFDQHMGMKVDPHTATGLNGGVRHFKRQIPMGYAMNLSGTTGYATVPTSNIPVHTLPTVYLATADHIKFEQPEGVNRDQERYDEVVSPLRQNEEVFLRSKADEESVVAAIRKAVQMVEERLQS